MSSRYHRLPQDGAWRRVTLDHVEIHQTDTLWLHCGVCPHRVDEKISDFRARIGLPGDVPLKLISIALKCSRCGERKAHCWPKPYGIGDRIYP